MKKVFFRRTAVTAFGAILGLIVGIAQADVTIERSTSVDGVGAMALANMTGTSRTIISGGKSRTDTDTKMQSKIVGFLARNSAGPSAEIVLLDEDKLYHINIAKKEYTETTFEQIQAQMKKASDQMNNSSEEKRQPSAVDQSKCKWLPAKVNVNKTGEKAQFAGYDSERVTITASQPCEDPDTGSICEVALVLDEWLAPGFTENSEVRKFYLAYAQKMGFDPTKSQDATERARAMFSQYKGIWTEVSAKMQNIKGYPVRSSFTLALGGAQCKDSNAQQQAQPDQASSSSDGDSPRSPNDIAGAMVGKLGGLFHKKQDDAPPPAAAPTPAVTPAVVPPGDVALMTVSSQLTSVSTASAGPDAFAVPAGFKKVEMKTQ
jgi:hypothetical protein